MSIIYDSSNCWHRRTLIFGAQKQFDVIVCNLQYFKTSIAQCDHLVVNEMQNISELSFNNYLSICCGVWNFIKNDLGDKYIYKIFCVYIELICHLLNKTRKWYMCMYLNFKHQNVSVISLQTKMCTLEFFFQRPTYMCILIIWWKGWGVFSASIRDLLKTIIKE